MSKENTLDNFEGFETVSDIDFFGEAPSSESPTEDVLQKVQEDTLPGVDKPAESPEGEAEPGAETQEEKLPEVDFFGESSEGAAEAGLEVKGDVDESEEDGPAAKPTSISSASTLEFLKQKGLVDYKLEEGEELTDSKADEILEDSYDDAVETRVQDLIADMPDEVKNIVKYSLDGGNVGDLLSKLASQPSTQITKDLDLDNETNQEMIIRAAYKAKGEDAETTDAYIDFLKDSKKLKAISEKEHGKLVEQQDKLTKEEAKRQTEMKAAAKENHRKFKNELSSFINDSDVVAEKLSITKKDKRELPSYIADKNVKLDDGRQVTSMQAALYDVFKDKEKTVILAKLLKNDFDFSDIAKEEQTKAARNVRRDLNRSDKITPDKGSSQPAKKKALSEYF